MKALCITFLVGILLIPSESFSKTYYVSPSGLLGNMGNDFSSPKDVTSALALVVAGDSILLQGGRYIIPLASPVSINSIFFTKSGQAGNPICLVAYNNSRAVFDFSFPPQIWFQDAYGFNISGSYWYFKGIDITRAGYQGAYVKGAYNTFENCAFYDNRNTGLEINKGGSYTTVINCDAYRNYDPKKLGSMADGFGPKQTQGPGNKFIGCRAWENSDDGYDCFDSPEIVTFENCWAFRNGIDIWQYGGFAGNGNGFKVGGNLKIANIKLTNCIAFGHPKKGFDQNNNFGGITIYNCFAYLNAINYGLGGTLASGQSHILRNNISLEATTTIANAQQSNNSWNTGFSASKANFQSLDTTLARIARNPNGSLPETQLFRLKPTSTNHIDKGINVGLPYNGSAPDLGCFETGATVNSAPTVHLIAPANGSSSCHGSTITLTASASDSDGSISKVEFFDGTALIGASTASPYTISWVNASIGTHSIKAIATDNLGATTTSTNIDMTVNALPSATISAGGPTTFTQGASVLLSANSGTGLSYRWLNGVTEVGLASTYTATTGGNYTVEVTNTSNCKTTSSLIVVTVNDNLLPRVAITLPASNASFTSLANVTLTAEAVDEDGTVSIVDFYNGAILIGSVTASPYNFFFTNLSEGTYTITARATDNLGGVSASEAVTFTVKPNQPSIVHIVSPLNNASISENLMTIDVHATDQDGSITLVEYLDGNTVIATSTTYPYTYTWNNPSDGMHVITVRVTDSNGGVTTSSSTTVTVGTSTGIFSASNGTFTKVYPNPSLDAFTIQASQEITSLSVYNVYGIEVIKVFNIRANQQAEIGKDLKEGSYVLMVRYASERMEVAKILKIE